MWQWSVNQIIKQDTLVASQLISRPLLNSPPERAGGPVPVSAVCLHKGWHSPSPRRRCPLLGEGLLGEENLTLEPYLVVLKL